MVINLDVLRTLSVVLDVTARSGFCLVSAQPPLSPPRENGRGWEVVRDTTSVTTRFVSSTRDTNHGGKACGMEVARIWPDAEAQTERAEEADDVCCQERWEVSRGES
jgi:hypothetical protein